MNQAAATTAERVNGERLTVLGWTRAILMQLAHPLVAAGVDAHSSFRETKTAWAFRLHGTVRTMLEVTFGNADQRQAALGAIRAIHDRVNGTTPQPAGRFPGGSSYSAHDPELLLWVHATLLDSIPLAYEYFVAPLTSTDHDAYCADATDGVADLGLPLDRTPVTAAALQAYIRQMQTGETLAVTRTSRALAEYVLTPPFGWATGPVAFLQREFAIGTLPTAIRELYGFDWSEERSQRLQRWCAGVRRVRHHTADRLARWPVSRQV